MGNTLQHFGFSWSDLRYPLPHKYLHIDTRRPREAQEVPHVLPRSLWYSLSPRLELEKKVPHSFSHTTQGPTSNILLIHYPLLSPQREHKLSFFTRSRWTQQHEAHWPWDLCHNSGDRRCLSLWWSYGIGTGCHWVLAVYYPWEGTCLRSRMNIPRERRQDRIGDIHSNCVHVAYYSMLCLYNSPYVYLSDVHSVPRNAQQNHLSKQRNA